MNQQRPSHAYMIVGPESPERENAIKHLAAAMMCPAPEPPCGQCRDCRKIFSGIHPDVTFIDRLPAEKGQLRREIVVDQIREATSDTVIAPNEAQRKVYVLREADRLNPAAQNALLKALEEPPGDAGFILCTAAADALLPTVRSRCVRVDGFRRVEAPGELSDFAREYFAAAASGNLAETAAFCLLRTKLSREETESFLDEVAAAVCDILCARRENPGLTMEGLFHLAALMEKSKDYLRHNVAPKQVFGVLAAETLR